VAAAGRVEAGTAPAAERARRRRAAGRRRHPDAPAAARPRTQARRHDRAPGRTVLPAAGAAPGTAGGASALRLDAVSVRLGGVRVLVGVRLAAAAGELVGLMGPNGAGKSALLRAAAGLLPAAGAITLLDRRAGSLERREGARTVASLPQHGLVHWPLPVG